MKKTSLLLISIFALSLPVHGYIIELFVDIDTSIERSNEIVIVKCVSGSQIKRYGLAQPHQARVNVLKLLKGERALGNIKITTFHPLKYGKRYLLFGRGSFFQGIDFHSIPELSAIEIPSGFMLETLDGMSLKEQVTMIFKGRQSRIAQGASYWNNEKDLLAKALPSRTIAAEQNSGDNGRKSRVIRRGTRSFKRH